MLLELVTRKERTGRVAKVIEELHRLGSRLDSEIPSLCIEAVRHDHDVVPYLMTRCRSAVERALLRTALVGCGAVVPDSALIRGALVDVVGGGRPVEAALIAIACDSIADAAPILEEFVTCLLYTSPSPRDRNVSRMPSSA